MRKVFIKPSVFICVRLGLHFCGCVGISSSFDMPDYFNTVLKKGKVTSMSYHEGT